MGRVLLGARPVGPVEITPLRVRRRDVHHGMCPDITIKDRPPAERARGIMRGIIGRLVHWLIRMFVEAVEGLFRHLDLRDYNEGTNNLRVGPL